MKLYIKQKVFSWRDRFFVKDETGHDKYVVEGTFFTWGRKLHVYDSKGKEVAFIRRKVFSFLPKYYIEINSKTVMLSKNWSFIRPRFHLVGLPWTMEGDFWAHEYTLKENQERIMEMSKHWFTWGDSYELDIKNPDNELVCLCIALTVDCMKQDSSSSHASSSH